LDPNVSTVTGLCSVDMWSPHTQSWPKVGSWSVAVDCVETGSDAPAYGRGDAERMMAVGVMLIMVPLVSSRAPKCKPGWLHNHVSGGQVKEVSAHSSGFPPFISIHSLSVSVRFIPGALAGLHRNDKSDSVDLALFAVGWILGWLLLWRMRPLPPIGDVDLSAQRPSIAIVIPARDEAGALPHLVPGLVDQLRPGDELLVVDDHSGDATGEVAARLGARVLVPPALPDGWLGKPHACWHGARSTTAPLLVFVDADVRPAPDLLDRVAAAWSREPDAVISLQPWHQTEEWVEQASLLANVTSLMGAGGFTIAGPRVTPNVAFGPVLAVARAVYDDIGGHRAVRTMHTEDIGLARLAGRSALYTGRPDTSFRMYPGGLGQLVQGWTRSIATGARFTSWWLSLAVVLWVWSLAGGWLTEPLVYPLSAAQFWVLGRRAGSMHPVTALLFPLAVAVFAWIFLRSLFALVFRRDVRWKQRSVAARPD
jgi:4,4'-diaponeurosporenoate glycosyltransferase